MKKTEFKKRTLDFFQSHERESFKTKEVARRIGLTKQGNEYQALKHILRELQDEQLIVRVDGRKWKAQSLTQQLRGSLRLTSRGHGIVLTEETPPREIFINRSDLHAAIDGDDVEISIFAQKSGERLEGEVIEIIERKKNRIVGTVKRTGKYLYVEPDGRSLLRDISIAKTALHGARDGDRVIVELDDWTSEYETPHGVVIEVIGKPGSAKVELRAIAERYNFKVQFSSEAMKEAEAIPMEIPRNVTETRLDLRGECCFTIDPEDAKDFDDAVSIRKDEAGNYVLGVHIADVSFYVSEGSALDKDAYERGTSVYLVDGVIPMLPEKLSNEICSLREKVDRLTYSCIMTVTPRGAVQSYTFHRSIINSAKRFSYEDAQHILTTKKGAYLQELELLHEVSKILFKKRMKDGSIDFEVPEVKFVLDAQGAPKDIVAKPRLQSMRIIEECMLLANKVVATHVHQWFSKNELPYFLYRVHDVPDEEKVRGLLEFVQHCGVTVQLNPKSSKSFQKMLDSVKGSPHEAVINDVAIRSMAKAAYSDKNLGHFGLGFTHYAHFTSPIRRYPDIMVHRILDRVTSGDRFSPTSKEREKLKECAQHTSKRERDAIEAERESIKIKQVEYMKRHLGAEFDGVIDGVMPFGLFVELTPTLVEGLIHIRSLEDDYYTLDEKQKALIGRRSKKIYRLGDRVRVKVARVDSFERRIDFVLVP